MKKELEIVKKISDDAFYDKLKELIKQYKEENSYPSSDYKEEFIDLMIDIEIYDKGFSEVFKSETIITNMQYGFTVMMLRKCVDLYNNSIPASDSGKEIRELLGILRYRFEVKGQTMFELQNIITENKNNEILKPILDLISNYITIYDNYNFCYSCKEEDELIILKNIYTMTINIRNGLQQYNERKKEVTVLNNIIDLLLYDTRLILEGDNTRNE